MSMRPSAAAEYLRQVSAVETFVSDAEPNVSATAAVAFADDLSLPVGAVGTPVGKRLPFFAAVVVSAAFAVC
jgi:hypothetical protein